MSNMRERYEAYKAKHEAELAVLREELAQARNEATSCSELKEEAEANYSACRQERDSLRAQVKAFRKDAERYQWMRVRVVVTKEGISEPSSVRIGGGYYASREKVKVCLSNFAASENDSFIDDALHPDVAAAKKGKS